MESLQPYPPANANGNKRSHNRRMLTRRTMTVGVAALGATFAAAFASALDAPAGQFSEAVFTDYSPLSSNAELARRLFTPLAAAHLARVLAQSDQVLSEQAIDLSQERFGVYVPARRPASGYALLVFVPPWPEAKLPRGWSAVLDQYGVIFVSAARSGNDASVLGRREPLALLAEQNVIRRYPVDPERVFIAGFSGGSRVAMHLALGYPDIFRGAILNAGSDPIGGVGFPLPPRELFVRVQGSTRIVYVTGDRDFSHLREDTASITSMRRWCVFDVEQHVTLLADHAVADPGALSRALEALLDPPRPDPDRLMTCRAAVEQELATAIEQVESLAADGKRDAAQALLGQVDRRFGGLAAPRSVDLASDLLHK
jgi:pimeloyl-ACP methyl ester carboxylesterase